MKSYNFITDQQPCQGTHNARRCRDVIQQLINLELLPETLKNKISFNYEVRWNDMHDSFRFTLELSADKQLVNRITQDIRNHGLEFYNIDDINGIYILEFTLAFNELEEWLTNATSRKIVLELIKLELLPNEYRNKIKATDKYVLHSYVDLQIEANLSECYKIAENFKTMGLKCDSSMLDYEKQYKKTDEDHHRLTINYTIPELLKWLNEKKHTQKSVQATPSDTKAHTDTDSKESKQLKQDKSDAPITNLKAASEIPELKQITELALSWAARRGWDKCVNEKLVNSLNSTQMIVLFSRPVPATSYLFKDDIVRSNIIAMIANDLGEFLQNSKAAAEDFYDEVLQMLPVKTSDIKKTNQDSKKSDLNPNTSAAQATTTVASNAPASNLETAEATGNSTEAKVIQKAYKKTEDVKSKDSTVKSPATANTPHNVSTASPPPAYMDTDTDALPPPYDDVVTTASVCPVMVMVPTLFIHMKEPVINPSKKLQIVHYHDGNSSELPPPYTEETTLSSASIQNETTSSTVDSTKSTTPPPGDKKADSSNEIVRNFELFLKKEIIGENQELVKLKKEVKQLCNSPFNQIKAIVTARNNFRKREKSILGSSKCNYKLIGNWFKENNKIGFFEKYKLQVKKKGNDYSVENITPALAKIN